MYVCLCNGITDREIRGAVAQGARSLADLQASLIAARQGINDTSGLKKVLQAAQIPATSYFNVLSNLTMPEILKAVRVQQAFQQVLDDPAAAELLQHPAMAPLLAQAAE